MVTAEVKVDRIHVEKVRTQTVLSSKLRAGIVGAGLMGRWHADALEKMGGQVVGIADLDISKAERIVRRHRNAKAYARAEDMLANQQMDVLHICSPTVTHVPIARAAIEKGIHVLVEKPLAANAEDTRDLYDLASAHSALVCPVHQFTFQDGVANAKKRLAKIGRIIHIEANVRSAGGAGLGENELDRIADDILPHSLSLISMILKGGLSAVDWNILRPASGEMRISGRAGEVSLSIFISMSSRPTSNSLQIVGADGTIHIDLFHGFSTFEPGANSRGKKILHPFDLAIRNFSGASVNLLRRALRREPAYPGLRNLIGQFYKSICLEKASPISPAEAIDIARTRDVLIGPTNRTERSDRLF
jgi:predicted dehydrogenase